MMTINKFAKSSLLAACLLDIYHTQASAGTINYDFTFTGGGNSGYGVLDANSTTGYVSSGTLTLTSSAALTANNTPENALGTYSIVNVAALPPGIQVDGTPTTYVTYPELAGGAELIVDNLVAKGTVSLDGYGLLFSNGYSDINLSSNNTPGQLPYWFASSSMQVAGSGDQKGVNPNNGKPNYPYDLYQYAPISFTLTAAIPEPSTIALLASGFLYFVFSRKNIHAGSRASSVA